MTGLSTGRYRETETEFWRRKALERAQENTRLIRENRELRDRLEVAEG